MSRETNFSAEGLPQVKAPGARVRVPVSGVACHSHMSHIPSEDSLFWNLGIGCPGEPGMLSMALSPLHLCPLNGL